MSGDFTETKQSSKLVYSGKMLQVHEDQVSLPDGTTAQREYVVHPGAALILPMFDDDSILLERQYRYPVGLHLYELPAGKFEPGEPSLETARRELLEETGEDPPGCCISSALEALACEQISTEAILYGERVAVDPVTGLELTLEVGGPDRVGGIEGCGGRPGVGSSSAAPSLLHESSSLHILVEDSSTRDGPVRVQGQESSSDLSGTPPGSVCAEFERSLDDLRIRGEGMGSRSMRSIRQPIRPFGLVSVEPLVAGFTANAVSVAELGVGE